MPYTKTNWVDRSVQYPSRFTRTSDGTYDTLVQAPGTIAQAGTPITANALNNLETQYDQAMADYKVLPAWQNVTTQNGWYWDSFPGQFYKDPFGAVHLRGILKPGILTPGTTPFQVPSGCRPVVQVDIVVKVIQADGTVGVTSLIIQPSGNCVIMNNMNITAMSIDNIHFRTDS
jgi:hypothetical protein